MSNTKIKEIDRFLWWILSVSRPRIWMYTAGPFFFGFLFWYHNFNFFLNSNFLPLFFWLTFPANVFLYALNDAFDYDTDLKNPKKQGFELKSTIRDTKILILVAVISGFTFLLFFRTLDSFLKTVSILWFLIVVTYNVPPFRFKSIPVADLFFAFSYYLWGIFGYYVASGGHVPSSLAISLMILFGITMHIYSSSGDIEYDKSAGIQTISTMLGSLRINLLSCIILILSIFVISMMVGWWYISIAVLLYLGFFTAQFVWGLESEFLKWYRYFILLHYVAGGILTMSQV